MKMMTGIAKWFAQGFRRIFPVTRQSVAQMRPATAGGQQPWYEFANVDGRNQEYPTFMLPLFPEEGRRQAEEAPFRYWEIHNIDGRDEEYPMAMLPLMPSGREHRETGQAESRAQKLSAGAESFFCCATG